MIPDSIGHLVVLLCALACGSAAYCAVPSRRRWPRMRPIPFVIITWGLLALALALVVAGGNVLEHRQRMEWIASTVARASNVQRYGTPGAEWIDCSFPDGSGTRMKVPTWEERDLRGQLITAVGVAGAFAVLLTLVRILLSLRQDRYRAHRHLCLRCGYSLAGSGSAQCPECGLTQPNKPFAL